MTKVLAGIVAIAALILTYPVGRKVVDTIRASGTTQEEANKNSTPQVLPALKDLLNVDAPNKATPAKETLVLESKNTVTFRGPVMGTTVAKAIKEIAKISRNIPKTSPIYLVMDTPGGGIMEGADFIDFLQGIPQEVRTVTLFSASMGFHIVESNPGKRLITQNGVLMSHRAKGGVEGQFDGELESEYRMVKRKIDYLELTAANRLGLSLDAYKEKIKPELWVHGFDAADAKVADSMTNLRCGDTMDGEDPIKLQTLFGEVTIVFDKCPLIKDPIRIDFGGVPDNAKAYVKNIVFEAIYDKQRFVKDVILTNQFNKIFPVTR